MGYSYTQSGALCCDICGAPGAVKIRCPHGWCQPIASCSVCKPRARKIEHKTCEHASHYMRAREAEAATLRASGLHLLTSGMQIGYEFVKSCWTGKSGDVWVLVPTADYQAHPTDLGNHVLEYIPLHHGFERATPGF